MENAFARADAIIQLCGGIFGIGAVAFIVYSSFFRKKKAKK